MGEQVGTGFQQDKPCIAGANPVPPELMSAGERLHELAEILTAGFLRLRRRGSERRASDLEKKRLDFGPERRVHAPPKTRRNRRA